MTGAIEYLLRVEVADLVVWKRLHADVSETLPQASDITNDVVMASPKDARD